MPTEFLQPPKLQELTSLDSFKSLSPENQLNAFDKWEQASKLYGVSIGALDPDGPNEAYDNFIVNQRGILQTAQSLEHPEGSIFESLSRGVLSATSAIGLQRANIKQGQITDLEDELIELEAGRGTKKVFPPVAGPGFAQPANVPFSSEDTPEQNQIGNILSENKEKEFVQRILRPDDFGTLDLGGGQVATHLMSFGEEDGKFFVYPAVVTVDGKLEQLSDDEAWDHARRTGERIEFETEDEAAQFSKNYKNWWDRRSRGEQEKRLDEVRSQLGGLRSEQLELVGESQEFKELAEGLPTARSVREFVEAEGFQESASTLLKNFPSIVMHTLAESAPSIVAPVAAGAVGTATGGPGVGAAAAFTGGGSVEFVHSFQEFVEEGAKEKGIDATTPEGMVAALQDEEIVSEATKRAAIRGSIIGTVDAFTAGMGSLIGKKFLGRAIFSVTGDPLGGAGGEALAQVAAGQEIDVKDIVLEGIGQFGTGAELSDSLQHNVFNIDLLAGSNLCQSFTPGTAQRISCNTEYSPPKKFLTNQTPHACSKRIDCTDYAATNCSTFCSLRDNFLILQGSNHSFRSCRIYALLFRAFLHKFLE